MKEKKMIIVLTSERVSIGSCSRMVCVCVCVPLNVGICIVQNVMRPNTIQLCHVDVVACWIWKTEKNRNRKTDNNNIYGLLG